MKKWIVISISLLAVPLISQTPDQVLREVLGLSDAQAAEVQQLLQSRGAALEPLQLQIRQAEAQLAQLVGSPSPDPCAIGTLVQSIRALQQEAEQHQQGFREALAGVLTEEQRHRLDFIFSVEGALRAATALHQLGL